MALWQHVRRLRGVLVAGGGLLVCAIATTSLLGWLGTLTGIPGIRTLTPVCAAGLALSGAGLALLGGDPTTPRKALPGRLLGALSAAVGVLALVDRAGVTSGRTAEGFLSSWFGPAAARPVGPATASAMILIGMALLARNIPRLPPGLSSGLALAAGLLVLYGPADRLDADPLDDSPPLAVAALLVLCAGTLAIRADQGVPSMFSSPGPGGLVARRMAPLVAVPFAAVALALRYGGPTASTIAVLGTLLAPVLLLGVLAHTARRLDREHAELRREQAELRDERDFAGSLMQSMDEGVLVLDTDLRVIDANRAWCELSGLDRDDVIGEPPPYDRDPLSPNRPRPGNDWVARDQYIERSDGTMVPVMATRAAVVGEDGRTQAFIATYLNITSHKRADDRMAEQAGLLERANDELRETNHRLEQAAAFKGDLMSLVTHEMSQPLSSVSSLAELLTDTWGMLDEEVRQELTAKIYKNAQRLVGLVRDMLLLYHLDTGTVTARRSPVLVDEAMDGVIAGFAGLPEIVRDIEPAACALVDGSHLSQVLTNLLRNAVSYGQPPITVSARQCGDHLVLTIEDRGTGIPDEVRSRMFDRAVRPSTASGTGLAKGRGLGLLIARHLVTANGGTIGYQPVEPTGARLVVTLEAAVPPEAGGVPLPVPGIAVRQ